MASLWQTVMKLVLVGEIRSNVAAKSVACTGGSPIHLEHSCSDRRMGIGLAPIQRRLNSATPTKQVDELSAPPKFVRSSSLPNEMPRSRVDILSPVVLPATHTGFRFSAKLSAKLPRLAIGQPPHELGPWIPRHIRATWLQTQPVVWHENLEPPVGGRKGQAR